MAGLRQEVLERPPWNTIPLYGAAAVSSDARCRCDPSVDHARVRTELEKTIRREVIPRLLANRGDEVTRLQRQVNDNEMTALTFSDVVDFADILLSSNQLHSERFIASQQARGVPVESVYLDLLAPTARRLGDLWSEDLCDFCEVTIALCHLHRIVRDLSPAFHGSARRLNAHRSVLLAPSAGEQHTFGIHMVAEFFRRAGWTVTVGRTAKRRDLIDAVRDGWFTVMGMSLSCDNRIDELASTIQSVRRASRNPLIGILVGGRVFNEHPELVQLIGADGTAFDGRDVARQARYMSDSLPATI